MRSTRAGTSLAATTAAAVVAFVVAAATAVAVPIAVRGNEPVAAGHASVAPDEHPTATPGEYPTASPGEHAADAAPGEHPTATPGEHSEDAAPTPESRLDRELARRLAAVVNATRRAAGLKPVTIDPDRLAAAAEARAIDMVRTRTLSPGTTAAGFSVEDLVSSRGVRWVAGGEAVGWAVGSADEDSLNGLVVSILANPQNRVILLTPSATHAGLAVAILDGGDGVRLPGKKGKAVPPSARLAVASLIVIEKEGPASPRLSVGPSPSGTGRGATISITPDGPGRLSVVVTDDAGDLLQVITWDQKVRGSVTLRWDGRIAGTPARPGVYEVRAFTIDAKGVASDPARAPVTVLP